MVLFVGFLNPADVATAQPTSRAEISAGYLYLQDAAIDLSFRTGWTLGAAGRLTNWLSVVAAVDASERALPVLGDEARLDVHAIMAGLRTAARVGPFREVAHVLVGRVQRHGEIFGVASSSTALSLQAGLGIERAVTGHTSLRLFVDRRFSDPGSQIRVAFELVRRLR